MNGVLPGTRRQNDSLFQFVEKELTSLVHYSGFRGRVGLSLRNFTEYVEVQARVILFLWEGDGFCKLLVSTC